MLSLLETARHRDAVDAALVPCLEDLAGEVANVEAVKVDGAGFGLRDHIEGGSVSVCVYVWCSWDEVGVWREKEVVCVAWDVGVLSDNQSLFPCLRLWKLYFVNYFLSCFFSTSYPSKLRRSSHVIGALSIVPDNAPRVVRKYHKIQRKKVVGQPAKARPGPTVGKSAE